VSRPPCFQCETRLAEPGQILCAVCMEWSAVGKARPRVDAAAFLEGWRAAVTEAEKALNRGTLFTWLREAKRR
jgi:hypothetical protein